MKVIIFLCMVLASSEALFFDFPEWNGLMSTYAPLGSLSSIGWDFDSLPRTLTETANRHFEARDDLCNSDKKNLLGLRYWYRQYPTSDPDPALNLLFDRNGIIAGISTSIPKSKFTPPAPLQNKNYQDDGDYWTLAAYFIHPTLICGAGRTKEEFKKTGTGTGLWIQTGPNPITDFYHAPAKESDIKTSNWGSGKCFKGMGQHYWYNVTKDMSCDDVVPNCILYNNGKLTAFCFATNGFFASPRYDYPHPQPWQQKQFMDPVPDCYFSDPTYKFQSTIRIYFNIAAFFTSNC